MSIPRERSEPDFPTAHPKERLALPYGGDAAVARSIVRVHVRNPWTGRCRACGDPHPCGDRLDACVVLDNEVDPGRPGGAAWVIGLVGVVLCGVVTLFAAAVAAWIR